MQCALDYSGWTSPHTSVKRVVCLPTLQKNIKANFKEPIAKDCFQFGAALEWQHYLLEYIFELLETKDLRSASLVNPKWNEIAKREFKRRATPEWITLCYNTKPRTCLLIRASAGLQYNNSSFSLITYCPDMIRLNQQVWLDRDIQTTSLPMPTFAEYIDKQIVVPGADYCIIPCTKIVPAGANYILDTVIFHGIFIPFIPNIRTTMFDCDTEYQNYSKITKNNEQVKCILIFNSCPLYDLGGFFDAVLKKQSFQTVALGGGFINKMDTSGKNAKHKYPKMRNVFGIAFVQKSQDVELNFNSYSLLFNYYNKMGGKFEEFESELIELKKSSILRKHGIVFSFCYFLNYRKINAEIIEKHFPKYTLLGFGLENDEVLGWNTFTMPESESVMEKLPTKTELSTLHSRSLSLVLVTWGRKLYETK